MSTFRLPSARRIAALILVLAPLGAAHADWLVLQRVTDAQGEKRSAYTWVGEGRLRYDDGQIALIARTDTGLIHVLDHQHKTRVTRRLASSVLPPARSFTAEGSSRFRRWNANRYLLSMGTQQVEVGTTYDVDATLIDQYRELLTMVAAGVDARIAELPGFPVWTAFHDAGTGELLGKREVMSIVQRPAYSATYRISGDYQVIDAE